MKYLADVTTLLYKSQNCRGCGRCSEVCPHGVFKMPEKIAIITNRDLCMECGACAQNCEFDAIFVEAGVGCAYAIINGILTGGEPSCDCQTDQRNSCC